jgi:hypothetical protein
VPAYLLLDATMGRALEQESQGTRVNVRPGVLKTGFGGCWINLTLFCCVEHALPHTFMDNVHE